MLSSQHIKTTRVKFSIYIANLVKLQFNHAVQKEYHDLNCFKFKFVF